MKIAVLYQKNGLRTGRITINQKNTKNTTDELKYAGMLM